MDFIKSWSFNISITLIISILFSVIAPRGSMGRFYKVIISMFIFAAFITPLINLDLSVYRLDFDFEEEYRQTIEESVQQTVAAAVNNVLTSNSINNSTVSVDACEENDEIVINSVSISVSDGYDKNEVYELIFKNLGIVSEVHYVGE